jgi:hypothetical protein
MPDGIFQTSLSEDMYHNGALLLFLLCRDEKQAGSPYSLKTIKDMVFKQITREHIISQTPNWTVTSQGFADETDYNNHLHMFGNLSLLSKSENSKCQNKPTHTKMTDPNLYLKSIYAETRHLAHTFGPAGGVFNKSDLLIRTKQLTAEVVYQWAIW